MIRKLFAIAGIWLAVACAPACAQVAPSNNGTPTAAQNLLNGFPFVNGAQKITGQNVKDSLQSLLNIINGMGFWDANGNYSPPPVPVSVIGNGSSPYVQLTAGKPIVNVACTGIAPVDTAAINAADAAASLAGTSKVTLSGGTCALNSSVIGYAGVTLEGQGGANYGLCDTTLSWVGPAGGTMVNYAAAPASNLVRPGLSSVCLNGNGKAAIGLNKIGVYQGNFTHLYITGVTSRGVYENVAPGLTQTIGQADQLSIWDDVSVVVADPASCWEIGSASPYWDVASNTYRRITCQHQTATGFLCGNSDGNTFDAYYDLAAPVGSTPAGKSFEAEGGTTSTITACREHHFTGVTTMGGSANGGLQVDGGTYPSFGLVVDFYKIGDGEKLPVIAPGASATYMTSLGDFYGETLHGINRNLQNGFNDFVPTASCGSVLTPGTGNAFVIALNGSTAYTSCTVTFNQPLKTWPICQATGYSQTGSGSNLVNTNNQAFQNFTGSLTTMSIFFNSTAVGAINVHCL